MKYNNISPANEPVSRYVLMPVSKDCHRVNISIQLEHLTLSCYKGWSVKDHEIFVTVIKSGK